MTNPRLVRYPVLKAQTDKNHVTTDDRRASEGLKAHSEVIPRVHSIMSKKTVPVDYVLLVDCAESFHKMGELFIDGIGQRFPEGLSREPPSGLGELICCATNLAFSLELYLKALHAQLGEAYPQEHDLSKLYVTLPEKIRQSIERDYDEYVKSVPAGVHASITVAKGPKAPPMWTSYSNESKDLVSVLHRSRDIFRSWRYLFEVRIQGEGSYETHQFEYLLLHLACKALRTQVRSEGNPTAAQGES